LSPTEIASRRRQELPYRRRPGLAATKGGAIAKQARKALEAKTGRPVVSGENFLPPGVAKPRKLAK